MAKPKILIIEDNRNIQQMFSIMLRDHFEVLQAFTLTEAELLFYEEGDHLAAIAVDACLEGSTPDTIPLVAWMHRTFDGPIIAISNMPAYNDELVAAGCTIACTSKAELPHLLMEILTRESAA